MEHVYVLVRVKPGFEQKVGDSLRRVKEAKELHPLFGEYDFILKLEGQTHEDIARIVLEKIRSNDGIQTTKTLVKTSF